MRKKLTLALDKKIFSLAVLCAVFVFCMTLLSTWKFINYRYNAMDFAIFHQVFFNTVHGSPFALTIHPPTYLNDHFNPVILLLSPLYFIFQHPLTLNFLQNLALAVCIFPIYLIAQKKFSKKISALLAGSFLINPFVLNISLFEFHLLTFSLPLLFFSIYYYSEKKFILFVVFSLLALLVREDVSLFVIMFSVLALLDKRPLKWKLFPLLAGGIYFVLAMIIISVFSTEGSYKFLIYYSWLGDSTFEIVKNFFLKPHIVIGKLFAFSNIEMILGLLLPFAFLPLISPRYLILSSLIFAQIVLGAAGGSGLILKTQYSTLFLPSLFVAFVLGLKKATFYKPKNNLLKSLAQDKFIPIAVVTIAILYSSLTLGPIAGTVQLIAKEGWKTNEAKARDVIISQIPKDASVASTYDALLHLSGRKNIHSLNYVYVGSQQFNKNLYLLPKDTEYIYINFTDLITYEVQYKDNPLYSSLYEQAAKSFVKTLEENKFNLVSMTGPYGLFKKNTEPNIWLYSVNEDIPERFFQKDFPPSRVISLSHVLLGQPKDSTLHAEIQWILKRKTILNHQLALKIQDSQSRTVYTKIYPISYHYPTSLWEEGQSVRTRYEFLLPKNLPDGPYNISLAVFDLKNSGMFLNPDRSTSAVFDIPQDGFIHVGTIVIDNDK